VKKKYRQTPWLWLKLFSYLLLVLSLLFKCVRSVFENAYIDRAKTGKESELYTLIQRAVHTPFILCENLYLGELYGYLIGTQINCFEANSHNMSETK